MHTITSPTKTSRLPGGGTFSMAGCKLGRMPKPGRTRRTAPTWEAHTAARITQWGAVDLLYCIHNFPATKAHQDGQQEGVGAAADAQSCIRCSDVEHVSKTSPFSVLGSAVLYLMVFFHSNIPFWMSLFSIIYSLTRCSNHFWLEAFPRNCPSFYTRQPSTGQHRGGVRAASLALAPCCHTRP
jgi:hypothetical protein